MDFYSRIRIKKVGACLVVDSFENINLDMLQICRRNVLGNIFLNFQFIWKLIVTIPEATQDSKSSKEEFYIFSSNQICFPLLLAFQHIQRMGNEIRSLYKSCCVFGV